MGNKFIGLETGGGGGGWLMGRCTSLVGLKGEGGGRRDQDKIWDKIQCGMCYGSVAMKWGGCGRYVNEVERVEQGKKGGVGHVGQCCKRTDL